MGTFSIFNLLRGRFMLLPSFCSLPHYALLVKLMVGKSPIGYLICNRTTLVAITAINGEYSDIITS